VRILANTLDWLGPAVDELRAAHDLVTLDADAITRAWTQPDDGWWRRAVPDGWVPDVALFAAPESRPLPPLLSALPCPVVLWVGDWHANWEGVARIADQAELVLTDATGVAALRLAGLPSVAECAPWTWDPRRHRPDWEAAPRRDVGFLGRLDEPLQRRRHTWIARLGRLPADIRVQVCSRIPGDDEGGWVQRSRITFDFSLTGDVTPRTFIGPACGSMTILNADAAEQASRWFDLGRELVIYDEDTLPDIIAHYLHHDDERRAIARAGWERVQHHGPHQRLDLLLAQLARVAGAGRRRASWFSSPRDRARQGGASAVQALTATPIPAALVELAGYEEALSRAEADDPTDVGVHLATAGLYRTVAATGSAQGPEALIWAGQHIERAALEDPDDATIALSRAQLMHLLGDDAIAHALAHQLKVEILGRRMVARPDGLPLVDSVGWRAERQEMLLVHDDPEPELTRLALVQTLLLSAATAETAEGTADALAAALAASGGDPWIRLRTALALLVVDPPTALVHTGRVVQDLPIDAVGWNAHARALLACGRDDDAAAFVAACTALAARIDVPPRLMAQLRSVVPTLAPSA
jgi:hypothetical protein